MNQAANFFWTILFFAPVVYCWATADALLWCYIFSGISLCSLMIPARMLQLSNRPRFYQGTGVTFIRKFAQNGDYLNRLIRKSNPGYRIIKNKQSATMYLNTITMYERYHLICLVFFTLTSVYALMHAQYWLAAAIITANIFYNIYPILLQQYNRARVLRINSEV